MSEQPNGMIPPCLKHPAWGFSEEDFTTDIYFWRDGKRVLISLIMSRKPGNGAFSRLVKQIEAEGLAVAVLTPSNQMRDILSKWGFEPHIEENGCEVWMRP